MDSSQGEITQLLVESRSGSLEAQARLIPLVYDELHRLAEVYMRHERPDHTLQPTALVNEAYLRLAAQPETNWKDRAHFLGIAARLMRQILAEHARAHRAKKRGAFVQKLSLDEALDFSPERSRELIALDDALEALSQLDARQAKIVEMHYFGGCSVNDIAAALNIGERTVERDLQTARLFLKKELEEKG